MGLSLRAAEIAVSSWRLDSRQYVSLGLRSHRTEHCRLCFSGVQRVRCPVYHGVLPLSAPASKDPVAPLGALGTATKCKD